MKKILTVIVSVLIHYCSFSQEGPDSTFIIRQYGFEDYGDYEKIRDSIGKIWNIRYRMVAGCVVTEEFEDSIRVLNDRTKKNLSLKYGEDWEKRFFAEVDAVNYKLEYDRENVIFIKDTIENKNFCIEYTRNYYGSKKWFTLYSKKGLSSSKFNIEKSNKTPVNYLFRGYDNILYIEFPYKKDTTKYYLEYEGIGTRSIELIDSSGVLFVNLWPGPSKKAEIELKNNLGLDTTLVFKIINLPKPILYLNKVAQNEKINTRSDYFELSFNTPEPFQDLYTIEFLGWELYSVEKKYFYGTKNYLSKEAIEYIKSLKSGTKISFSCQVRINKEEGVTRKVSGEFIVQ